MFNLLVVEMIVGKRKLPYKLLKLASDIAKKSCR